MELLVTLMVLNVLVLVLTSWPGAVPTAGEIGVKVGVRTPGAVELAQAFRRGIM